MSVIDFNAPSTLNTAAAGTNGQARPKAMKWLNIGYQVDVTDPETGEVETITVTLPVGLPIDTMSPRETNSKSPKFRKLMAASNKLRADVETLFDNIAAGETAEMKGLRVFATHGGKAAEIPEGENELLTGYKISIG